MAAISVTPEQLRASANVYSTAANEIQTQLNNISTENGKGRRSKGTWTSLNNLSPTLTK